MSYMLDSDSVNFLIREHPQLQRRFKQALADNERFILSPIVHFEVTRYLDLKGAAKLFKRSRQTQKTLRCPYSGLGKG
jgi:hypothetical protein